MNLNMLKISQRILFSALVSFSATVFAMPDDHNQLLALSADNADLNQQTHHGEYSGDVQLDQGTSHLRASKAVTEGTPQNKLLAAIAMGDAQSQAHYWTQTAVDKPLMHAYANTIRYYPDKHIIELIGNARVEQGKNSVTAAKITYDTLKQHVVSNNEGKERTVILLHPEKKA